jgi:hypothetical protein
MRWALVVATLVAFLHEGSALAQNTSTSSPRPTPGTYVLLLASGFLCDSGDAGVNAGSCPAIARGANGDRYEMSGAGTFEPASKTVKAAGTFHHKAASGELLETGVWTSTEVISFVSYGVAPGVLAGKLPGFAHHPPDPRRQATRSTAMPTGGLAILRTVLVPVVGPTKTATLQVNCALGEVPRERSIAGVRIRLEGETSEYVEDAAGAVMFLATRPTVSAPK